MISARIRFFLFLTLILISNAGCSQTTISEKVTLRVLTFNIYHGATMKGDFDLDVIARVISNTDPDLVALQEVDYKTARDGGLDLATYRASGMAFRPRCVRPAMSCSIFSSGIPMNMRSSLRSEMARHP